MNTLFYNLIYIIILFILLLVSIAFFTLGERKLMAAIQRRKGPDVVGFWGFLQPIADGAKLLVKELIFPIRAITLLFFVGPVLVLTISILNWAAIPYFTDIMTSSLNVAVLFIFTTTGLNVYGLIISGWSSNSHYAFLGSIRATAQMISYELIFGTINLIILLFTGSFNYSDIVNAQQNVSYFVLLSPVFLIFLIVMLAETNRTPFDLAEAEAELVAGYNVEYSSIMFAFFFLGEYANMFLLSVIGTLYFFGGFSLHFYIKVFLFCALFVWVRATLPRYRYDQLMLYGWKILLPLIFGLFIFYSSYLICIKLAIPESFSNVTPQDIIYYRAHHLKSSG